MSRLAEFRALEQKLAQQLAELESLKNDDRLKREIEFEQKLRGLLGEYGYSLRKSSTSSTLKRPLAVLQQPLRAKGFASLARSSNTRTRTLVKSSKPKAAITSS